MGVSKSPIEILSDTGGVNFGPYLKGVLDAIRKNWYSLMPAEAQKPVLKKGKVVLEFGISKDGNVRGLHYASSSGDVALDRAAYGGITASNPFPPLPPEFTGKYLGLRFTFRYNQGPAAPEDAIQAVTPQSERVRLSEILVSTESANSSSFASQQIAAARAKAEDLLAQIRGGAKFEDVARANSDGPSTAQGGDLGYFQRGALAKSIEDIVFTMKVDDVSNVIRTKQGFVIKKVTDHRGEGSPATAVSHP